MDKPVTSAPIQMKFSRYEKVVIGILGFLQFTVILDFMIISPLGAIVMPSLHISPQQFGLAVSFYAFSAGVSGFLAAGLPTASTENGCCCSSISGSCSAPCFARWPPLTRSFCWRAWLPDCLAG